MNKSEFAAAIADKVGLSKKQGDDVINAIVEIITDTLSANDEVAISGFGTFSSKVRAGRMGVNPQDPDKKIQIPPTKVAKFKPGKGLKDALKAS